MSDKKPWCAHDKDASCNCPEGFCWALDNLGMIDHINELLRYGLTIDEIGEDFADAPEQPSSPPEPDHD